jgi:hypothetical protein
MHWMKEQYPPVLKGLLEQFIEAKKDARVAVVALAAEQIRALAQKHEYDMPEFLERVSEYP